MAAPGSQLPAIEHIVVLMLSCRSFDHMLGGLSLVMENGQLLGLLTTDNLSEFLLLRRFGMEPVV